VLAAAVPAGGVQAAQDAAVRVEENVRAAPNGVLLGRLAPGGRFPVLEAQGQWRKLALEGWVWGESLEGVSRQGFDLVVSADGGENLRVEPQGRVLGRLEEGTLLHEVERDGRWVRVHRDVWIWAASLSDVDDEPGPGRDADPGPVDPARVPWRTVGASGGAVLSAPDGDTLARVRPGGQVAVLARRGNWARVRIEGWAWLPEGEGADEARPAVQADLTPDRVVAEPQAHRGAVVVWDLQFISLERAEPIRTDFYEGEPFLLARALDGGQVYVYVAVPPERMEGLETLSPLERIRVTGRIRTGAASLTGNPILDLLDLERR